MENNVPIPIQVERSTLVNPVHGQHAVCSSGPMRSHLTIFHVCHPYKPSGDHQGIALSISELSKQHFWQHWTQSPGNPYGHFVARSPDLEGSTADASREQGEDEENGIGHSPGSGDQAN